MKTTAILAGVVVFALASLPIQAANDEDLILNAGGGNTLTLDLDGTPQATGTGVCSTPSNCITSATLSGGDITFLGHIAGFTFDLDSGQGLGGVTAPTLMNTTTINTLSTGAGSLTVTFSDEGYTDLASTLTESASDTYTADTPNGSTANFTGYVSGTNALNTGTLIGTVLASTMTAFPSLQSDSATHNYANAQGASGSLTEVITLGFSGAGTIDTTFAISNIAVPEPASIVFLGSTLLGLAAFFRKKLAKQA